MVQTGDTGGKTGSGGPASSQETEMQRKERLRKLALETIDLGKDPYILRNHLGSYECKLCLTLHRDEGNYLVHTQGKRHQTNLARRAAREAKLTTPDSVVMPVPIAKKKAVLPRRMKIGRPGYRINKLVDPETNQKSLLFHVEYPEIEEGTQPRHRFMSSFEQKIEPPDRNYQYLIFAADPYETIAFKIPNKEIERDTQSGKFFYHWNKERKIFTLQIHFKETPVSPPHNSTIPTVPNFPLQQPQL